MKKLITFLLIVAVLASCSTKTVDPCKECCKSWHYQVTLEDSAMVITDHGRHVATVPYEQTGILDSVFMADNE